MFKINSARLYEHIEEMGRIGRREDGIYCLEFSPEENAVHELAAKYMREAGLEVRVDAAGNLFGRKAGKNPAAPIVMTGSHLDTVYGGGAYDGRLGVLAGIEVLQSMNEQGILTEHPLEVVAYRGEEGTRYPGVCGGAPALIGYGASADGEMTDRDGVKAKDAVKACGFDIEKIMDAKLPDGYAKAHLELHIEQGPVLEAKGLKLGIVTGIASQLRGEIKVKGTAAHAGTTPFELRKDALCAASEMILAIEELGRASDGCVATVGSISVEPGGVNIVPGAAKFTIDVRNIEGVKKEALFKKILARIEEIAAARKLEVSHSLFFSDPMDHPCDPGIQQLLAESCRELGYPEFRMPSGAGHDSSAIMRICPAGMIFVPSKDGLSHNGAEYTSEEDCAAGAMLLGLTMQKLADSN